MTTDDLFLCPHSCPAHLPFRGGHQVSGGCGGLHGLLCGYLKVCSLCRPLPAFLWRWPAFIWNLSTPQVTLGHHDGIIFLLNRSADMCCVGVHLDDAVGLMIRSSQLFCFSSLLSWLKQKYSIPNH